MYSVNSFIYLVMVAFAVQSSRDFSCRIPLFSRVTLHVGRLSRSRVVDSSIEFVAIISFQLSLGKLELRLSSN